MKHSLRTRPRLWLSSLSHGGTLCGTVAQAGGKQEKGDRYNEEEQVKKCKGIAVPVRIKRVYLALRKTWRRNQPSVTKHQQLSSIGAPADWHHPNGYHGYCRNLLSHCRNHSTRVLNARPCFVRLFFFISLSGNSRCLTNNTDHLTLNCTNFPKTANKET